MFFANPGKGWNEKRLSEICEKITDGTHQTPTYYDTGSVFLSSRNVISGRIDWNKIRYIDKKQHLEMHKRVAPRLNDILLAKNGTTGVAALVDKDIIFDIYVSLALLRAKAVILPNFLLYFINSPVRQNICKYQHCLFFSELPLSPTAPPEKNTPLFHASFLHHLHLRDDIRQ